MGEITSYKGHSFLEITDAGKASAIPQPCVDEMAWEGNDHPTWGEMLLHSYPVDGVMAGPPNISIDGTKCIYKIMWVPLFGNTYRHLVNAENNPTTGIHWMSWSEAKALSDGLEYAMQEQ